MVAALTNPNPNISLRGANRSPALLTIFYFLAQDHPLHILSISPLNLVLLLFSSNMSALSIPTLRNAVRTPLSLLRTQRRYARVHDVRFVTTQQPAAKVLEKYKGKLEQKAKQYV